jgi:hypothetical protein
MDNLEKRIALWIFSPVVILAVSIGALVMGYLGSLSSAVCFLVIAISWATAGAKIRHDALQAEVAALRAQLSAAQQDQPPGQG